MKYIVCLFLVLTLSGCGAWDRFGAYLTGSASHACMDGVLYYQFTSGAVVAYNKDGTLKTCGD